MKPLLQGIEANANFSHYGIGVHLPIVLQMLNLIKGISDLNLTDNSLSSSCWKSLSAFVETSDSLLSLVIDDNPYIKANAMKKILESLKENKSIETLGIANTGCNPSVGKSIAEVLNNCSALIKLDITNCQLGTSMTEVSNAIANASKIKWLAAANNNFFLGAKKAAQSFGTNAGRSATLSRIDLSHNSINDEQVAVLLKGLADSPALVKLNLSYNCIDEASGRAVAGFLAKSSKCSSIDLSQNPLLNVTINIIKGQREAEGGDGKPAAKKDKKAKGYTPGVYLILAALGKNTIMKEVKLIGLVVDLEEWGQKIEQLRATNTKVQVIDFVAHTQSYNFTKIVQEPEAQEETPAPAVPAPETS